VRLSQSEGEGGGNEDEEGERLACMQAEIDGLHAENKRLRAALMHAHASGVPTDTAV